jgi:ABC-type multidrug transport system permease subunit
MSFETNYKTWHTRASYIKSGIRLIGCAVAVFTGSVVALGVFLAVAELVGIAEEWV